MENKDIRLASTPEILIKHEISKFNNRQYPDVYQDMLSHSKIEGDAKEFKPFAENVFYETLKYFFSKEKINLLFDKISVVEDYYYDMSSEILKFTSLNEKIGKVEKLYSFDDIFSSHIQIPEYFPLDYLFTGYVAAAFALIHNKPVGSYRIERIESDLSEIDKAEYRILLKQKM